MEEVKERSEARPGRRRAEGKLKNRAKPGNPRPKGGTPSVSPAQRVADGSEKIPNEATLHGAPAKPFFRLCGERRGKGA